MCLAPSSWLSPTKVFRFLATDGSLCVQGTQADAHGFSASICEICAICGQKKAKLTEGQRPKPYESSGFTALNTYRSQTASTGIHTKTDCMKRLLLPILALALAATPAAAQLFNAQVGEDYQITVQPVTGYEALDFREGSFEQLPGFPKATPANPTFKDFRNVTLADVDGDGVDDILWATNNKLFAYRHDGLIWERTLSAVAIYPPSVGDITGDGQVEIVLATGGVQVMPRLYAFRLDGSDLPGWPLSLNNNWVLSAPALADLDGDGALEVIVGERTAPTGRVQVLRGDGSSFSLAWPLALPGVPAITPSIGDVDGDGEKDIVVYTTGSRYILGLDGQPKPGFPIATDPAQRYSYQSPVLIAAGGDVGQLDILGAAHGDAPEFHLYDATGAFRPGWPVPSADNFQTFSTPTVVEIAGETWIFMGRNLGPEAGDMLFAWDTDGNLRDGFPISKIGGCEGIISVADIDDDGDFEIVFGSTLFVGDGPGFIHAYHLDGTEVEGFPLRPRGLTYLNGAALGDINGDGMMDLVALSYTLNFGAAPDTVFLNAYHLNVPYSPERVLWSTYKGSNTRDGLLVPDMPSALFSPAPAELPLRLFPNPAAGQTTAQFELPEPMSIGFAVLDAQGKILIALPEQLLPEGLHQQHLLLDHLPAGWYWVGARSGGRLVAVQPLMVPGR
jgi:hypothetical protein